MLAAARRCGLRRVARRAARSSLQPAAPIAPLLSRGSTGRGGRGWAPLLPPLACAGSWRATLLAGRERSLASPTARLFHSRAAAGQGGHSEGGEEAAAEEAPEERAARLERELREALARGDVGGTRAEAAYALAYTCGVCSTRSVKKISKRAYHHGVVIITCPGCGHHHLIADHLKWFGDEATDIEKIMREKGEEFVRLNRFALAGQSAAESAASDALDGPMLHVEGFDMASGTWAKLPGEPASPPPVPVPTLEDEHSIQQLQAELAEEADSKSK